MKEIKNTTIYTSQLIKKFLEIYYFEKVKVMRIILNIFIIVIIVSFFRKDNVVINDVITFIFALFGIIELNTSMLQKLNYFKLSKQNKDIIDSKFMYVFKKDDFTLNKDENIKYDSLYKIIETNDCYYLYVNSSRVFIVDKSKFNSDEVEMLTNIFKEKVTTYKFKKNV